MPILRGSYCQGSLAGSSYLAHTPGDGSSDGTGTSSGAEGAAADDVDLMDVVTTDDLLAEAGSTTAHHLGLPSPLPAPAAWVTGVVLPPEEMEWRMSAAQAASLRELPVRERGAMGRAPFDPSHFMFSTPASTAQALCPTLSLYNVARSEGAVLQADYTLRLHRPE